MTCNHCKYWTQYQEGECSQKTLTTERKFVNQVTLGNFGCSKSTKKVDNWLWTVELTNSAADELKFDIDGQYTKDELLEIEAFINEKLIDFD